MEDLHKNLSQIIRLMISGTNQLCEAQKYTNLSDKDAKKALSDAESLFFTANLMLNGLNKKIG